MTFRSLVSVVSEQCQEIKQALTLFPYFETWKPDLIAECCRVSSVVEFPPDEIILGPDTGNSDSTYFILTGICKMLQNLFINLKVKPHQKALYELHKCLHRKASNPESKNEEYASRLFNQHYYSQKQMTLESGNDSEEANSSEILKELINGQMNRTTKNPHEGNREISLFLTGVCSSKTKTGSIDTTEMNNIYENEARLEMNPSKQSEFELIIAPANEIKEMAKVLDAKKATTCEVDVHVKVLDECKRRRENLIRVFKKTAPFERPKNGKCFFIQTGFLSRGACFGLEKSENENYIITVTKVKCLKVPRRFLLQHNSRNIWSRIRLFHSLYVPKKDKILEHFMSDRLWTKKKRTQTAEITSLKNLAHYTSMSEVPYSIRLSEPR